MHSCCRYLHSPEQVKHRVGELMLEFDENKDDALSEPEIGDGLEAVVEGMRLEAGLVIL